jgi:hypothetical protein
LPRSFTATHHCYLSLLLTATHHCYSSLLLITATHHCYSSLLLITATHNSGRKLVLDHMTQKRKKRLGLAFDPRPTKKKRKQKSGGLSTCGCGLTDRNTTRHTRHARHQSWLSDSPDPYPSALSHIPQAGDERNSSLWGPCILASETHTGWNVWYPGVVQLFFASAVELGL